MGQSPYVAHGPTPAGIPDPRKVHMHPRTPQRVQPRVQDHGPLLGSRLPQQNNFERARFADGPADLPTLQTEEGRPLS